MNDGGQDVPGYGCSKPITGPNGEVFFENHAPGMSLRQWYSGLAMQGILAAESEDAGYTVTYLDGNGKETYRRESPPVIDGKEDLSKPWVPNKILRTVEQNQARAAVAAADALIAELSKPQ